MSSISVFQVTCLVSGFIRESYSKFDIPIAVVNIIEEYYPQYCAKWSTKYKGDGTDIQTDDSCEDDCKAVTTKIWQSMRAENGIEIGMKSTDICIKFRFLCSNYYCFFGVVPEECTDFSITAYSGLKDAFGIAGKNNSVYCGTHKTEKQEIIDGKLLHHLPHKKVSEIEMHIMYDSKTKSTSLEFDYQYIFDNDQSGESNLCLKRYIIQLPDITRKWFPACTLNNVGEWCIISFS